MNTEETLILLNLRFQAGILGYSIAGMKAFEGKFSYKNQPFS